MERNIKELLIILRDRIKDKDYIRSGLCLEAYQLYYLRIITIEEWDILDTYISSNRPKKGSKYYWCGQIYSPYYWPKGEVKPRLNWLNSRIESSKINAVKLFIKELFKL